ncbi:MAG TPA: hypothetical protein VGD37_27730 [Kofleriaceae bacterium]|jgi:hypothetical protein
MAKTTSILACCVSLGVLAGFAPTVAHADEGASLHPGIGGHVGVAVPLVFLKSNTQTIGDQFTLAYPIGIGFKLTEKAEGTPPADKTNAELDIVFHTGIGF